MSAPISILHLEDSLLDAEFVRDRLVRAGLEVDVDHVIDRKEFTDRLAKQRYDIILSDYRVPTFDNLEALDLAQELQPCTPFLFISGTMGEELAVESLHRGATDYILKERLTRLPSAIQRALTESKARSTLRETEATLAENEARYRTMVEASPECVKLVSSDGTLLQINRAGLAMIEGDESVVGQCVYNVIALEDREAFRAFNERICRGERGTLEFDIIGLKGTRRHMETTAVPLANAGGGFTQLAMTRDVTSRKRVENELRDIRSRMEAALAAAAIGTWTWDVQEDRFYGDESLARIFAVPPQAVAGGPIAQMIQAIHPDDVQRVSGLVDRALSAGGPYEADYRVMQGDGTSRWVTARGQVELNAEGVAVRFPGVVIDITDRKRAEENLDAVTLESERRRRLYETILSNTPDFAYVFDLQHRFVYVNEGLLKMWGKTWYEAIGKTCLELGYEPWHAAMHNQEIDYVVETKKPIRGEVPFSGTFGRRIYDYIFVPVIGVGGEVEAVAGTTRDVTDRKGMEEELRDADRRKDDFIALLAHELRNPLAPIRNGLQVLRLAANDAVAMADAREMMDRQLSHMVRLIDDLLDISRINRNKLELRRVRVSLGDIIASAVETSRPAIAEAGHELTITLPGIPVYLNADPVRLAQVFSNLLANSAKYTPKGGRIGLAAECSYEQVVISVCDTGIGIPAAALPLIFDMFSQVDRPIERSTGGLGIGLALVKGLVEMHEGTVTAESQGEGTGSTFRVKLPILQVMPKLNHESNNASHAAFVSGLRILVVDDNQDGAQSLALMLRMMKNDVRTAKDGVEAIEVAEEFRPDVILMDVGMPRLNGLEATKRIREQAWGEPMTIIALTGWGQERDREQSRAAGCNGHLVKPVNQNELQGLLKQAAIKRT